MSFAVLPALAAACLAGLLLGAATPLRTGPRQLWDVVLAAPRTLPAILVVPSVAWWLAAPQDEQGLVVAFAFLPAWLHTLHGVRRRDAALLGPRARRAALALAWRDAARGLLVSLALSVLLLCASAAREAMRAW